ncbi:ABC transporter permease [Glutamicibacter sp. 287]|uniref:ABC transporter permease n=1 Tax=unclassified Glutamicibacter TaxID=2627139 RepID=UPI0040339BF2
MSTQLATPTRGKVTFGGVLRSESIRFFSLNSTRILLLVAIVLNMGIAALGVWGVGSFAGEAPPMPGAPDMSSAAFTAELVGSGLAFSQLILGVLGVLLVSGEFTTGSAVSTFLASPQRLRVFAAKATLITLLCAVVQVIGSTLAYLVCMPLAKNYNMELNYFGGDFQNVLWFGVLAVVMAALIGLALGALLRNSAGGITSLVALFFVLPAVTGLLTLLADWVQDIVRFLPDNLSMSLAMPLSYPSELEQWQQLLGVAGWTLIPLILAAWLLKSRDV